VPAEPVDDTLDQDSAAGVVREIDAELARLRQALDRIARFRGELDRRVAENAGTVESAEERVAEMAVSLHGVADAGQPADGIYETLVLELTDARSRLREALDALHAPSKVPTYQPQLDLANLGVARFRLRIETARELIAELAAAEADAREIEQHSRWESAEGRGSGKTTWLNQVPSGDHPKTVVTLDHRPASADELAQILGSRLVPDAVPSWDLERLGAALLDGPRGVVIVDLAQHLFLAAVGGYAAFDGFATLIERTRAHLFWVCGMSAFAWRHLRAARPTPIVFRHHVALGGWTEERIRELIRTRVEAAGVRLNYGDLVLDRLEGVSYQARLIESEEGYTRLLWDYSDGNPRVALHFFLRSLVPETSGSICVRLFRAPALESLEELDESALFTLAATIAHENLSLEDAAKVMRFSAPLCRIHLDRLTELGVLRVDDDRYRVTTFWHRAAVRLLQRKNLIHG
jgi:hypothetical protein